MNAFTKVLIILVLVLSLGFAASQIILYGKREKLGTSLAKVTQQLQTKTTEAKDWQDQFNDLKDKSDRSISDLRTQLQGVQGQLATANANVQDLTGKNDQFQASLNQLTTANQGMQDTLNQRETKIAALNKAADDLRGQVQDQVTKLAQVTADLKQSEAKAGDLNQKLTEAEKNNQQLKNANEDMTAKLVALRERGIQTEAAFAPPINAKILSADTKLKTAVIDKGSNAGVKPNTEFTIYRDSQYVARMYITNVDKQVALGHVIQLAAGKEPEQGDNATTTIR